MGQMTNARSMCYKSRLKCLFYTRSVTRFVLGYALAIDKHESELLASSHRQRADHVTDQGLGQVTTHSGWIRIHRFGFKYLLKKSFELDFRNMYNFDV